MKAKFLSVLLALTMVLSLLPPPRWQKTKLSVLKKS